MTLRLGFARGIAIGAGLAMLLPGSAVAAGGPPGVYMSAGDQGIVSPDGRSRYVTLSAGEGSLLARIATNGGRIVEDRRVHGFFGIPAVAQDLSPGGLSADGRTLVLSRRFMRLEQSRTRFILLDADRLRVLRRLTLPGPFTFDAISPDGSKLYLTQYESRTDPTAYAIRAYDVGAGKLLQRPVVDPTEPEEEMRGFPVTRAASPDGRWAYTLYDGNGGTPFIHALDTAEGTARCVDLDALGDLRRNLIYRLDLRKSPDGGTLTVSDDAGAVAAVDTDTFAVTIPEPAASASGESDRLPWTLLAAAGAGAVAFAAAVGARRRRRRMAAT